jgi:hypothetical protein
MDLEDAYDRIDELQSTLTGDALHQALADEAAALTPGEEGRAAFLNVLGEFLLMDGEVDGARTAYQQALDDSGPTILHPLAGLLDVAFTSADEDAKEAILAELTRLVRADELTIMTCEYVGEILEKVDELRLALRWFNIPLRDIEPDDVGDDLIGILNGHYRVRRLLDLPMDRFDEASDVVRARYRTRRTTPD